MPAAVAFGRYPSFFCRTCHYYEALTRRGPKLTRYAMAYAGSSSILQIPLQFCQTLQLLWGPDIQGPKTDWLKIPLSDLATGIGSGSKGAQNMLGYLLGYSVGTSIRSLEEILRQVAPKWFCSGAPSQIVWPSTNF